MALDLVAAFQQHLVLQLSHLLPEAQAGGRQRYKLGPKQLRFALLIVGGLRVAMLLHVPHRVVLMDDAIRRNLVLIETPVGQLLTAKLN